MTAVGTCPRSLSQGLILPPGFFTGTPAGQAGLLFQSSAPHHFVPRPPICRATTITAPLHRAKLPHRRGPRPLTLPLGSAPVIPQARQLFRTLSLAHAPTIGRSLGGFLRTFVIASSSTLLDTGGMKGGGAAGGEDVVVKVSAPGGGLRGR